MIKIIDYYKDYLFAVITSDYGKAMKKLAGEIGELKKTYKGLNSGFASIGMNIEDNAIEIKQLSLKIKELEKKFYQNNNID